MALHHFPLLNASVDDTCENITFKVCYFLVMLYKLCKCRCVLLCISLQNSFWRPSVSEGLLVVVVRSAHTSINCCQWLISTDVSIEHWPV